MDDDKKFLPLIAKQESLRVTITRQDGRLSRFYFPLTGSEKAIGLALAASAFIVAPLDPARLDRIAGPAARERLQ